MQIAAKGEFDEPCSDLRRSKQGANPDHSSSINTGTRKNRQQVSREAGRDESVRGECCGHQYECQAVWRQYLDRFVLAVLRWHIGFEATAWQRQGVKGRCDAGKQRCIDEIG